MKALPCDHCESQPQQDFRDGKPRPQLLRVGSRAVARLRDGEPYVIGRPPSRWPYLVYCARCQRKTTLTALQFNALPNVTPEQLEEHDLLERYTREHTAAGFSQSEARHLVRDGLTQGKLAVLTEGLEPPA